MNRQSHTTVNAINCNTPSTLQDNICICSGTGHEVWGNCNAPRAITFSALIYCLRCIVDRDIPLNQVTLSRSFQRRFHEEFKHNFLLSLQGCLKPVQIIIPKGSLLDPSEDAAVVGGNVLTSQRIVDVVLKAFGVCAASQGCMNNVTLGTEEWGYYETVAGGSGAVRLLPLKVAQLWLG